MRVETRNEALRDYYTERFPLKKGAVLLVRREDDWLVTYEGQAPYRLYATEQTARLVIESIRNGGQIFPQQVEP